MDLELAKTLYFRELDRRQELDSAPTFRVGVLALVAGVFSYYAEHFTITDNASSWFFLGCSAGALVSGALAIVWVIRSYTGFVWAYLPFADQLKAHYDSLLEYHPRLRMPTKFFTTTSGCVSLGRQRRMRQTTTSDLN
jgi:hypothetical protein